MDARVQSNMRRAILLLAFFSSVSFGQSFLFGVKSGVPLTDAFASTNYMGVDTGTHAFSKFRNYVARWARCILPPIFTRGNFRFSASIVS